MTVPRLSQQYLLSTNDPSSSLLNQSNEVSIVHLGIGAFHKGHQAVYTDSAMKLAGQSGQWNILSVSLRSKTAKDQLSPQDGLYTVVESDGVTTKNSIIMSVKDVLCAPESPEKVLAVMASESTKIISLTITEKGYCHDPASGNLNKNNTDIVHDLSHLESPKTAIGYLVASLKRRFEANSAVPTILCCDNLPSNGDTLSRIVIQFAELVSAELSQWIKANVAFPNTMVDRIVPATTEADIKNLAEQVGYIDQAMIKTEPFSQWVIENKFSNDRPQWESTGALIVDHVEPFEKAKLRLLNGSHSSLAYLGFLCGYQYVHEVVEDKNFLKFLNYLMKTEIIPTLTPPEGLDLNKYSDDLLARFSNSSLMHKTYQIAMDGSQKVPQRLLQTIEERLANHQSIDCLAFAVAGWLRYSMGFDGKGDKIEVQDPFANELEAIQKQYFSHIDELVGQYLAFDEVFPKALGQSYVFKEQITKYLGLILANGVPTALKALLIEIEYA